MDIPPDLAAVRQKITDTTLSWDEAIWQLVRTGEA
jgi:hypothetical protein